VYRVYVLDTARDTLRMLQLTIAEKEGFPAQERFHAGNDLVQFSFFVIIIIMSVSISLRKRYP
jgi:hypothetical protein